MKAEFGIPESYELVAPVILGHPAASHPTTGTPRKPFSINFYEGTRKMKFQGDSE
jgi:hypothetical protein